MKSFEETNSMAKLMTMAIDDMEALVDNPMYVMNASTWHEPITGGCQVCTAGAVMVNRLGANKLAYLNPNSFTHVVRSKLFAIDCLREGAVSSAYGHLGGLVPNLFDMDDVPCQFFNDDVSAKTFIKFWRDKGIHRLEMLEKDYA